MDDERFLSFEEPIKELAQKLSALRTAAVDSPALNEEISNLEKENKIFGHVARSYRSPRLDEIITVGPSTSINPLKHQFSHEVELGYEHNLSDQRYKISTFKTLIKI